MGLYIFEKCVYDSKSWSVNPFYHITPRNHCFKKVDPMYPSREGGG